ncbi:hypothetical protein [Novosphingobium sp. fls2-241-R2A-195]|uniref:hypothetical protein n=1 Tax=Novosphingobium sp. fls2-241-R2A-195 TaxID=3040296 RepID=UPI00254C725D|nr:hypothetical protein [Novosphingobium sp. fls2-241-R2A-195]
MVAPVDSKYDLKIDGETITLRLNFRSISLLEEAGLDLFSEEGVIMTLSRSAIICRCLAISEHPDMGDDQALAIVARSGVEFGKAVIELIARFGGKPDEDEEGNAQAAKKRAPRPRQKTSSSSGAKRATNRTPSGTKRRAPTS